MKIKPSEFIVFYEMLWDACLQKELNDKIPPFSKSKRPKSLWHTPDPKDKSLQSNNTLFKRLFRGEHNGGDPDYFFLIYKKSKKTFVNFEISEELSLYKGLKYLGYLSDLDNNSLNVVNPIKPILVDIFDKFKKNNAELIKDATQNTSKENTVANLPNEFIAVDSLIKEFYGMLHKKECLNDAWNLLTPEFQNARWEKDFNRFATGYINTKRIKKSHTFHHELSENIVDCKLFYKDQISNYDCGPLDNIKGLTIGEIDTFINNIRQLKIKLEKLGAKNYEEIKLRKLFEPTSAEFIWWFCELEPEKLNQIFPKKTTDTVYKLVKITCKLVKEKWFIDWIEGTPAYSNQ